MADITIYTTPYCGFCHMLKEYLDEKKIKYTNHDVSVDQKAAQEMIAKTHQLGVPVIDIDDDIIIGFDKEAIDQKLALK